MRTAMVTTMLVLIAASPSVAASPETGLKTALDRITAAGMPGSFAEVRRPTARAASGLADVNTGRPMRPDLKHRVGSITKTFVATTVLQLVGERRIVLDAPVSRYLPEYEIPGITVRMLLNHTSGIGDFDTVIFQTPEDLLAHRDTTFTPRQLARIGLDAPRTNPPGARWSYSNTNYVLAGLIIERVTHRPAAFEVSRRVIWPLGLRDTYLAGSTSHIYGPHAKAYIPWYEGELLDFSVYNMSWGWMLGDMVSTTHDINRFFHALLSGKLLRASELAQMQTTVPFDPAVPQGGGYGLGLMNIPFPCGQVWGHDGLVFGHSAISLHTADVSRQVTIAQNMTHYTLPGLPDPIGEATFLLLLESLCPNASAQMSPQQVPAWRSPIPVRPELIPR